MVSPRAVAPGVCRDESDLAILGAAVAGGCSYIVTGDKDLLSIGKCEGIRVVSPRGLWEEMKKAKPRR